MIGLLNLTDQKYIFQSRSQRFSVKQGDLLLIPSEVPYKMVSPIDVEKYILQIKY